MGEVAQALLTILQRGAAVAVEHDPEWASPCELLPPAADGMVLWRPVPMDPPADFGGLPPHPDLREFYGTFWGRGGRGQHSGEAVAVRVAWNAAELDRIRQRLSAELAERVPVCVAVTDSDWYFGVDNATGAVWLCETGQPPVRQVAPSLAAFLAGIT